MSELKIKDIYGTEIYICESVSGHFRLDIKGEAFPTRKHAITGEDVPTCISIPYSKAKIMLAVLQEYIGNEDDS